MRNVAPAQAHANDALSSEARSALAEAYRLLRALANKRTAPSSYLEAADVESLPGPSNQGVNDDMNTIAYSVTSDASDRALGAQSRPGLGTRPAPRCTSNGAPGAGGG